LRILHVLHNSLPLVTGYGVRTGYILRLQRLNGFEVLAVTSAQHPNGPERREDIDGVVHIRTASRSGRQWPLLRESRAMTLLERQVMLAVEEFQPHIVHAHSPVLVGIPAARVAQRAGLPFVYEVRDLWENAAVDRGRFRQNSVLYRLARAAETRVLRRADAVVAICESLRRELTPRVGHAGTVDVVANGVDVDAFAPCPEPEGLRQRLGLARRQIVLYAGSFQPYEGLELLVQAMPHVLAHVPDAHLLMVGGSASLAYASGATGALQEDSLGILVGQLGLQSRVTFTGRIPHEDVRQLYTLADIVAYPRLLTLTTALTTPLKPLEAMAMGRAVVVSDVPAVRELVVDGKTGVAFRAGSARSLADCCVGLLRDASTRARLGHAAREAVIADRQWPDLIARYGAIYARVLSSRGQALSTAQ
jgi:PEP-CTERM/exosortase A-associated glycosyltransferase